jgi:CheY-like chemotaxis protein
VFEMFSQVNSAIDRTEGGLGIGLALVKGLVNLHGGTVEAVSAGLGAGSEFVMRLPRTLILIPEAFIRADAAVGAEPLGPRCKVLVVDDNRDAAETLALFLRHVGHDVSIAHSGTEAMAVGVRQCPDAVVLDIGMPEMNGYEVAQRMREQEWGRSALLLAVTGWGQEDDKERARLAGFDQHLTKPVDPDEVVQLLSAFMNRRLPEAPHA